MGTHLRVTPVHHMRCNVAPGEEVPFRRNTAGQPETLAGPQPISDLAPQGKTGAQWPPLELAGRLASGSVPGHERGPIAGTGMKVNPNGSPAPFPMNTTVSIPRR